jgi:hypothetical protein
MEDLSQRDGGANDPVRTPTSDSGRCPLCASPNECAMARRERGEEVEQACWCVGRAFPSSLIRIATERDGGERCICEGCLERA